MKDRACCSEEVNTTSPGNANELVFMQSFASLTEHSKQQRFSLCSLKTVLILHPHLSVISVDMTDLFIYKNLFLGWCVKGAVAQPL